MCIGCFYILNQAGHGVYFTNAKAKLPVKRKLNDKSELITWGRRKYEGGKLPFGGCVDLDNYDSKAWNAWFPKKVIIPISCFVEQDIEGQSKCFNLTKGKWMQALLVRSDYEKRVYVITIKPNIKNSIILRWPKILSV